ncbi:MAG: capsid cement protein [Faecousia sp.]
MAKRNYNGVQFNQSVTIVEQAGAAIDDVRNRIVKYDGNGNVVLATAGTDMPIGIALIEAGYNDITGVTSGQAAAGDAIDIQIKDMGVVLAGAEIKKGQEVAAGADGLAAVAASGNYVLGIALENAAAGEYLRIQIAKYQKA